MLGAIRHVAIEVHNHCGVVVGQCSGRHFELGICRPALLCLRRNTFRLDADGSEIT